MSNELKEIRLDEKLSKWEKEIEIPVIHEIQTEWYCAESEIEICSGSKPLTRRLTLGSESGKSTALPRKLSSNGTVTGSNGPSRVDGIITPPPSTKMNPAIATAQKSLSGKIISVSVSQGIRIPNTTHTQSPRKKERKREFRVKVGFSSRWDWDVETENHRVSDFNGCVILFIVSEFGPTGSNIFSKKEKGPTLHAD